LCTQETICPSNQTLKCQAAYVLKALTEELKDAADESNGHEGAHAQQPVGGERQPENELHNARAHIHQK